MTNLSDFSDDEVTQILNAPRAVLKGAMYAAGRPGMLLFLREGGAGAKAFKQAQRDENDFVRSIALRIRDEEKQRQLDRRAAASSDREAVDAEAAEADETEPTAASVPDPAEARDQGVEAAQASVALLRGRAEQADVDAYVAWLRRIAARVGGKAKQGATGYIERIGSATES